MFSGHGKEARRRYRKFVEKGIADGRRPDLVGGGILRSTGGWLGLTGYRKAGIRIKGDERILGDSDFVESVLKTAREALEEKYELRTRGYDFSWVVSRVSESMGIAPAEVDGIWEVASNRQGTSASVLLDASKAWNDRHGNSQKAQDRSTGCKPVLETGRTNRERMHVPID
jgi:hypothetical protein